MTNVSKHKLSKKMQSCLFAQFTQLFAAADQKHLAKLFDALFTESEKMMFVKRVAIILLLQEQYSTYAISKTLKVSDATVRTILQKYETGQYEALSRIVRKKSFDAELFWETVEVLLRAGLPPYGKDRWQWLNKYYS